MSEGPGSSRLERALGAWLDHVESGSTDPGPLLGAHPDLRELLEPMLQSGRGEDRTVGDFLLGPELGRGGMGIVYEATQRSLGRKVALKVLAPALAADPGAIARFHREAAAVARLRHPGIVEIHGVGREGELHWFAMALVEGEPLHRCRERFREPEAAVALVTQVLDALQHAHAAGLVHRDVKPANILVRTDGTAVLTDFGLARADTSPTVTAEGGFLGTLDYAAPEQIQAQPLDARADVWSVGVVLAELLNGRHPFSRDSATATLRSILTEDPQGLARTGLHADLQAIVQRALEKDPARRYASAVAFLADLRAFQQGLPVQARLPSSGERLRRWARREPWRAFAAVLLIAGVPLVAGIGGYLWANAPRIEAAARAETARQREQAITDAWLSQADERYEEGLRVLAPWAAPGDAEVAFTRASLLVQARRRDEARAVLQPFAGERFAQWVGLLLDGNDAELPFRFDQVQASTPLECVALGQLAFEQVITHRRDKSFHGHSARWYGRAVALSPAPRAWLLFWWVVSAARARDDAAFATALAAYEHHFPGSRGLQLVYAYAPSHVPVARGLEVLAGLDLTANPRLHFARAELLVRSGKRAEAIAAYETALAAEPGNVRGWTELARERFFTKDFAGAVGAAQTAIGLDARAGAANGLAGAALQQLGRFADARPLLEQATVLEADDWKHFQNLGLALHELREDEPALAAFRKAAALAPTEAGPRACMARTLRRLGRPEEAFVAEVQASPFITPGDWRQPMTVAARAMEVSLYEIAHQQARQATQAAPERAATWWRLCEVHLEQTPIDGAGAAAAVAEALRRDPQPAPRERVLQARSAAANGEVQAAIAHFEAALADPGKLPPIMREKAERELATLRAQRAGG